MTTTNTDITTTWTLAKVGPSDGGSVSIKGHSEAQVAIAGSLPAVTFEGHLLKSGRVYNFTLDTGENLYIKGSSGAIEMILT